MKTRLAENYQDVVERVTRASKSLLTDAVVSVFGGAATGDMTAASDIDILIISQGVPKSIRARSQLKEALEIEAGLPSINPAELHLATAEEAEASPIYRKAIKRRPE